MSRGGGRGKKPDGSGECEIGEIRWPALTPLASNGAGLLSQGLLPSVQPAPKNGWNNGPFRGGRGSQRLPRMGE